jgi:AraC-like DNA-binding protein
LTLRSCERNGLLVTPPDLELDHRSSSWKRGALKPAKLAVFIVSRELLTDCLTGLGLRSSDVDMTYRALEPGTVLLPLTQALLADLLEGSPEGKGATERLARTLVSRLLLRCREPVMGRQVDNPIARVCRHIEANLHEPLNLQRLSDVAGMSQFHFCRVFHGTVGKSPHQYVMCARIDAARRLIWDPVACGTGSRQSMLDVGLACGFSSSSHFSTQFRKHTGQSPLEWRATRQFA